MDSLRKYFFTFILFLLVTMRIEAEQRTPILLDFLGGIVAISEGGNYSIDVVRTPAPHKSEAMWDYLKKENNLRIDKGVYFGNQNQSLGDRDASMAQIPGLVVFGVDANQKGIIPGVQPIGAGVDATFHKLHEFLQKSADERPDFIGFDVDDTLLGLRVDKTKEELLEDRPALADVLVKLILEGIPLVFFSDNGSTVTLKRIAYPLAQMLQECPLPHPVALIFYTSGMLTKITFTVSMQTEPAIEYDTDYGANRRLSAEMVRRLLDVIGGVSEFEGGLLKATGIIGDYYTQILTRKNEHGLFIRREEFCPSFKTQTTLEGNVSPPLVQIREYNTHKEDAAMLSIVGIPSSFRPILIQMIADQLASWD